MGQPAYLGNGCGLPGMVSGRPAAPTTSQELAVARGMEARLQEEPEPETEASKEAGG